MEGKVDHDGAVMSLPAFSPDKVRDASPTHLIRCGKLKELKRQLSVSMVDPKTWRETTTGKSFLHHAAIANQIDIIHFFLDTGKISTNGAEKHVRKGQKDVYLIDAQDSDGNTALHLAVIKGHVEAINALLSHNADDSILNKNQDPALHLAIRQGPKAAQVISEFIKHPNANINIKGHHDFSILHIAVESSSIKVLELMHAEILARRQQETDTNNGDQVWHSKDRNGFTPVHLAARLGFHKLLEFLLSKCVEHNASPKDLLNTLSNDSKVPLHLAVERGQMESVGILLKYGADPTFLESYQPSPLHFACSQGQLDILKLMVDYCGQGVLETRDREGGNTLHSSSASINCEEIIPYLVSNGINVNDRDINGDTPLANAVQLGSVSAVEQLLLHGADPLITDRQGRNALHLAVRSKRTAVFKKIVKCNTARIMAESSDEERSYPIHHALKLGVSEMVTKLLTLTTETFKDNKGNNYVHLVALSGNEKSLTELLNHLCVRHMVNEINQAGFTPLHFAAMSSSQAILKKLIDFGAVIHKNKSGHTPFMLACSKGNLEAAKLLYSGNTFQRNWIDHSRNTALHLAVDGGNPEVITFCLDQGMAITLNSNHLSYFDKILSISDPKLAESALRHKRWKECTKVYNPDKPHPLLRIIDTIPDKYGILLDNCLSKCNLDHQHPDYWEEYDFDCLTTKSEPCPEVNDERTGRGDEIELVSPEEFDGVHFQHHTGSSVAVEDVALTLNREVGRRRRKGFPGQWRQRENDEDDSLVVVRKLIKNRHGSYLLHPVVIAFIKMKWRGFGQVYHMTKFAMHFLLALFLSIFLLLIPVPQQIIPVNSNSTEVESESVSTGAQVMLYITLLLTLVNLLIFIMQVYIHGLDLIIHFASEFQEWSNLIAALCTAIFLVSILASKLEIALWNSAALAIFFAWFTVGLNLQFFNILNIGVYITMLLSTTELIFKVLAISFVFFLALSFPFYILVGTVKRLQYTTLGISLFTSLHSLVGVTDYLGFINLEQSDNPQDHLRFSVLVFLFLVVFIIMLPIVIINLLIGLAVGDIALIQKEAVISRRSIEVRALTSLNKRLLKQSWTRHICKKSHRHYPNISQKRSWIVRLVYEILDANVHTEESRYDNSSDVQGIMKQNFAEERNFQAKKLERLQKRVEELSEDQLVQLEGIKTLREMLVKEMEGMKHLESMVTKLMEAQGLQTYLDLK